MGYFYGSGASNIYSRCLTLNDIQDINGSVVENTDGTVSVYTPNGPFFLNKMCCETFDSTKNYVFDIDSQKCRWKPISENCLIDNLKVTINPYGNDGTIFYVDDSNEVCDLKISFDYLFKINCESLTEVLNQSNQSNQQISISQDIKNIENQILEQESLCETISKHITELNRVISQTSYSIECVTTVIKPILKINPQSSQSLLSPFKNTGFNSAIPFQYFSPSYSSGKQILCLTEEGLAAWSTILGNRYNRFINGDATSYSCTDFEILANQNASIISLNNANNVQQPILAFACTTPFGTKTQLLIDLESFISQQTQCITTLNNLNTTLISITTLSSSTCTKPIDVFETLDVEITLDAVLNNTLTTVATYSLLSPIGIGNLYSYLINNIDTGFLVCGEPDRNEVIMGITGCTPMDINSLDNVFSCSELRENLIDDLFIESGLSDITLFNNSLSGNSFSSKWLHHETIVSDPTIINSIANKKIKLSIKINNSCSDFCVLIDNIHLDKSCTRVSDNKMFISKPPSFELERIIDNKKSWIANTTFTNRTFNIKNNVSTNPIRQTDYDVNDERLIINTKEIDLDISIASAIETDVWCYIADNPCLLSALTQTNNCPCPILPCFKSSFNIIDYKDSNYGDLEDIYIIIRQHRNQWLKSMNERDLAANVYFTVKDSPYNVFLNPDLDAVRVATENAYNKANREVSFSQPAYIFGVTPKPNEYQYLDEPTPRILKCDCGDLMIINSSDVFIYFLSNNNDELEVYIQDITATLEPTNVLVSLNSYINEGNPNQIKAYSGTPQLFCSVIGGYINDYTAYAFNYNNYVVNDNVNTKGNGNLFDYRDLFTVQWDSTKRKCMAKNKDAIPEAFSVNFLKQDYITFCKYYAINGNDYNQCVADFSGDITYNFSIQSNLITTITGITTFLSGGNYVISGVSDTSMVSFGNYVYGDGITFGASVVSKTIDTITINKICTLTLDNVTIDIRDNDLGIKYSNMNTRVREYRNVNNIMGNEISQSKKRLYLTAIQDINGNRPLEPFNGLTYDYIPIDVTTTIRKGSINGPIVYQEEYRLNDPSSSGLGLPYVSSTSIRGLSRLNIPIGVADTNGFQYNTNPLASDYSTNDNEIPFGTYITGSTSGMPFFDSGNNTVDAIDFNDNYYVHLDIIDTSGNTYYATNNDFNLKDGNKLIKFPTTASTQTFDVNDAIGSIENKKQEFLAARDYVLTLITRNGLYING